ncbi:hypothetical protein BH09ACT7_BH09ACT7_19800 [soil metagenome]
MRWLTLAFTFVVALLTVTPAGPASAAPAAPDLSGYQEIAVDPYVDNAAGGGEVYFQTPDGLLCAMRPVTGVAGCDGKLPATLTGVNEIVLAHDVVQRGLRATANPLFVKPSGGAAPVLHAGQKIAYADFECAVGTSDAGRPVTMCTKGGDPGAPPAQWLVISSEKTGIGPRTEGLPEDFPDPNNFVVGDESYVVGVGAKNIFPTFTAGNGLTCKIVMFSGGQIGCDGPLPAVTGGENEVYAELPGPVGIRKTDVPAYRNPTYPGPVHQLPVGYRVSSLGGTCMSTEGGVACYGNIMGAAQGFVVSPDKTWTLGGS